MSELLNLLQIHFILTQRLAGTKVTLSWGAILLNVEIVQDYNEIF